MWLIWAGLLAVITTYFDVKCRQKEADMKLDEERFNATFAADQRAIESLEKKLLRPETTHESEDIQALARKSA